MKSKFSTTKDNSIRLYVGGHQKTRDYGSNSPNRLSKNMFTGQIGEFFLFDGIFTIDEAQSVYIQGCSSSNTNALEHAVNLKNKKKLIALQPELYTDSLSLEGEKQRRHGTLSATYIDPQEYHHSAQTFNSLPPSSSSSSISIKNQLLSLRDGKEYAPGSDQILQVVH